jgi:cell division protein FtsJ
VISNLISRPCTIVKPGTPTEDDYGNEIPGTPQLVETVCEFQRQTSRSESEDESRNQLSTSRWDVFFNDGEDVAEDYGLIEMAPLAGVAFLQGDFFDPQLVGRLESLLAGNKVGLVLSDMSPNISGIAICDQARVVALAELALDFAGRWLKPDGAFLVKVFQGHGFDDFRRKMRLAFKTTALRKPQASRDRSPEIYLLGKHPIA